MISFPLCLQALKTDAGGTHIQPCPMSDDAASWLPTEPLCTCWQAAQYEDFSSVDSHGNCAPSAAFIHARRWVYVHTPHHPPDEHECGQQSSGGADFSPSTGRTESTHYCNPLLLAHWHIPKRHEQRDCYGKRTLSNLIQPNQCSLCHSNTAHHKPRAPFSPSLPSTLPHSASSKE